MKPPAPPPDLDKLADRVGRWEKTVAALAGGYTLTLDDWLNDMDLRQLIAEQWPQFSAAERGALDDRLALADAQFRRATREAGKCLWGKRNARRDGWKPTRHWWYFRQPRNGDPELMAEIAAVR
ncbi:MAG: hypothetical protein IPK81_08950 [Rhodospirillales bacterium]|nr:MAG: hypothetical protein IPK81_08950 [Rhodospirillales bacterium]